VVCGVRVGHNAEINFLTQVSIEAQRREQCLNC
jgi:hypothetical protein